MTALDRKLLRDLRRLAPQLAAVVTVTACGVAVLVMSWSMLRSLEAEQRRYETAARFPDLFAGLRRAPDTLARRLAALPGIDRLETRVVEEATLRFPDGPPLPVMARLVSLPAEDGLCLVHVTRGRMPADERGEETLVSVGFAASHGLEPGDRVRAVLGGRLATLTIVGIATSPEYVYTIPPGVPFPDDRSFGVLWLDRRTLAAAFDMTDAFNDVVATLAPGADPHAVAAAVDAELERYGGLAAHGRADQPSHRYLVNELRELRNMGLVAPVIFLAVAAILMHLVLARLVAGQREQIATLAAFGYSPAVIARHYAGLAAIVVVAGTLAGIVGGWWLGVGLARMYAGFFRFPTLRFEPDAAAMAAGGAVAAAAAAVGVARALAAVGRVPPAAAMQPQAPARHRPAVLERLGLLADAPLQVRMVLRNLERRPLASALAVVGLALGVAVMVLGMFVGDAVGALGAFQFSVVQRYDRAITFEEAVSGDALGGLERLPGVTRVEPFRAVPAILRHAHHERREEILGLAAGAELLRVVDRRGRVHDARDDGLVVSEKLAELLGAREGDLVEVEVLEGSRPVALLPIADTVDDMVGTSAFLGIGALRRLLGEERAISGAFLAAAGAPLGPLDEAIAGLPGVAASAAREVQLAGFRATIGRTLLRMRTVNALFALAIATGVVAITGRQSLAERARDLASLRVLGFTRAEAAGILIGEQAVLVLAAIPLGLLLGAGFVVVTTWGYDTELFRVPVVIGRGTLAVAAGTVLAAAAATAVGLARAVGRLDLVAVLKARD